MTLPGRLAGAVWIAAAAINLAAGVAIASRPARQTDFESIARWGHEWLAEGANVYEYDGEFPDYPPNAIAMLSPLGVVPGAMFIWTALNLAMAPLACRLALRTVRPAATIEDAAVPIAMLLCWGGFRTLLQFTLLPLTLGLAAMTVADRRRAASGVLLGLALMKPQVAFPFVLWALFTRRFREIAVAVLTAGTLEAIYCVRAAVNPLTLGSRYFEILRTFYGNGGLLTGLSEIAPLAGRATTAVVLLLLAIVMAIGAIEMRREGRVVYAAPPLAALWTLVALYHLTYGFVVLLPLAAVLLWGDERRVSMGSRRDPPYILFMLMQAALVVDVPGLARRFGAAPIAMNFDRLLFVALFVAVSMLAYHARLTVPFARVNKVNSENTI